MSKQFYINSNLKSNFINYSDNLKFWVSNKNILTHYAKYFFNNCFAQFLNFNKKIKNKQSNFNLI